MATGKKKFDCIEFKRKAQIKIYNRLKNIPPAEQADFYRQNSLSGFLGTWWGAVTESGGKHHGGKRTKSSR
jgi:hypothetical protein